MTSSSSSKKKKGSKTKEFELDDSFSEKYGIRRIYAKNNTLVFETLEGRVIPAKYHQDVWDTIEELKGESRDVLTVDLEIEDDKLESFYKDFGQILSRKLYQEKAEEEEDSKSPSDILIDLAKQNSNLLFKDEFETPYARILNGDHYELIKIGSEKFKRYLSKLYYYTEGKAPYAEAVISAISVIRAQAEYEGPTIPLSLRTAWDNDNQDICYDLTNDKWQYIRITKQGWSIIDNDTSTPLFKRYYNNQTPQFEPLTNYEPNIFDRFLDLTNLKTEDRLLLKVYIVTLFIPSIQHIALQIHGGQGSAKSLLETFIKLLVDPATIFLLSIHKDRMEFIQQIAHNYLAFYDNLDYVPSWLSDEVCRAITGSGGSKRALYTDDDDIIYGYRRCLGFNGINLVFSKPDVLQRSIVIELDSIDPELRKPEVEMLKSFNELRPKLLGYIFDILVKALQIRPSIQLQYLPRMADSALWGEAISQAMGYEPLRFMNAYNTNREVQNIETIETNPLGQSVSRFLIGLNGEASWKKTTAEFLSELNKIASINNINTDSKAWPRSVNSLSRRLKHLTTNIREGLNFNIEIYRGTTGKDKGISFTNIRKISSPSSPSSPEENHAHIASENGEDIPESEDMYPHHDSISSPQEGENRAQSEGSEDSKGSEDISRTLSDAYNENDDNGSLVLKEFLRNTNREVYRCKEHPQDWYIDLKGLEESHFKTVHY